MVDRWDRERLRILNVEDDPNDAELIQATLESEGHEVAVVRVTTREELVSALSRGTYDLILSDYALPGFDGLAALQIAREKAPDLPFIIVSGQLGEEAAAESVRSGATDYVLKQRLSRLGPSVRRALAEADERRKRRQAEEALRQSEAQLRQAQKMEAVGRLAGGVAHDFNNLLTVILGYSQMLQGQRSPDEARHDLAEIRKAAERAASLTRQLLAFSRHQVLRPRVLDLNVIIAELDKMLRRLIGSDIDLLTCPRLDLGRIKADPGQIEQVILNLVVNARDAMPAGGKLTIEAANLEIDETSVGVSNELRPGSYVMLAISDTGCGMDAEILSRMFEPFFTTKEPGKGTGLGLSTVHGIVQQSGGHIEVYSEPGRGTTFKICFPRVYGIVEISASAPASVEVPGGSETILLVEDDELVRGVVSETLRRAGYRVSTACDRAEAEVICAACKRNDVAIDLMISDVVMPGMSIGELAERLKGLQPRMKLLYCSGYTDKAILHQGVLDQQAPFLQKPFTGDALLHKVREVLDTAWSEAA